MRTGTRDWMARGTVAAVIVSAHVILAYFLIQPLRRFTTKISGGRYTPASGPATICGVFVETDDRTGLAVRVEPIRVGGRLQQSIPEV